MNNVKMEEGNCGRPADYIYVLVHYIEDYGMNQSTITTQRNARRNAFNIIAKGRQGNKKSLH